MISFHYFRKSFEISASKHDLSVRSRDMRRYIIAEQRAYYMKLSTNLLFGGEKWIILYEIILYVKYNRIRQDVWGQIELTWCLISRDSQIVRFLVDLTRHFVTHRKTANRLARFLEPYYYASEEKAQHKGVQPLYIAWVAYPKTHFFLVKYFVVVNL